MTYRQHAVATLALGLPLAGGQLAQFAITLTDAVMLGWYDVTVLAAEILAGTLFFVLFIFGSGFAFAVTPLVAAAEGRGDTTQARRVTRMSLWLSMLYAVLTLPILLSAEPLLILLGQKPELAALAADYLDILGWGIFPALAVMVLKSHLAALERTKVVLVAMLVAAVVNGLFNYALIFGAWGFPELGITGAAIASLVMHLASLIFLVIYVQIATPEHALFQRLWRPDWEAFGQVFRLGWPIGTTTVAEVGLFAASSVMMGWLGEVPLAAHGIALQISSLIFMVHLGFSQAATVRVGRLHGRGAVAEIRRGAVVAITMSGIVVAFTIVAYLALPAFLIGLFLDPGDPARAEVIAIGTLLLAASALFQLVDAAQAMALGLLRGLQDTRLPMIYAAVSYWVVGCPVAYVLGFVLDWGGVGIWLGLATGLACAGVLMMGRFWRTVLPQLAAQPQTG
ncbi:MATE family efflux transporter [Pseudooceanicola aestuarii]|uniref:MATE family efflux transporter n=1 Tax=Pseudooceanicola aestuarii TaxID=2697319 RepID=UPI001EF91638|nr:MATE family efflux transporter [Pseudooceanicola aestuarii]